MYVLVCIITYVKIPWIGKSVVKIYKHHIKLKKRQLVTDSLYDVCMLTTDVKIQWIGKSVLIDM